MHKGESIKNFMVTLFFRMPSAGMSYDFGKTKHFDKQKSDKAQSERTQTLSTCTIVSSENHDRPRDIQQKLKLLNPL